MRHITIKSMRRNEFEEVSIIIRDAPGRHEGTFPKLVYERNTGK